MTAPSSVLLAGGGSAGHVSPLLAVADALRRRWPGRRHHRPGHGRRSRGAAWSPSTATRCGPSRGCPCPAARTRTCCASRGRLSAEIGAAATVLTDVQADVVAGFGGYVSTAAYLAARRLRLPYVVHEANTRPGLANRLGARFTPYVATSFAGTRLPHAVRTGLPLRREISQLDRGAHRAAARASFGLDPDRTTLLVTGGSLGAQRLNQAFEASVDAAPRRPACRCCISRDWARRLRAARCVGRRPAYVVLEYCDRHGRGLQRRRRRGLPGRRQHGQRADRRRPAGGLRARCPIGNGEQRLNAEPVVAAGGGLLVADADLTPEWVRRRPAGLARRRRRSAPGRRGRRGLRRPRR